MSHYAKWIVWLILSLIILFSFSWNIRKKHIAYKSYWIYYKKDNHKDKTFVWDYTYDIDLKKYKVVDVKPACQCGTPLFKESTMKMLYCPVCGITYEPIEKHEIKEALLSFENKIATNKYKKIIKPIIKDDSQYY
jgi:hypothetical protein